MLRLDVVNLTKATARQVSSICRLEGQINRDFGCPIRDLRKFDSPKKSMPFSWLTFAGSDLSTPSAIIIRFPGSLALSPSLSLFTKIIPIHPDNPTHPSKSPSSPPPPPQISQMAQPHRSLLGTPRSNARSAVCRPNPEEEASSTGPGAGAATRSGSITCGGRKPARCWSICSWSMRFASARRGWRIGG